MRFIFASKVTLYIMCLFGVISLIKNIKIVNTVSRHLLPEKANIENISEYKYILLWTSPQTVPFIYIGEGQSGFVSRNCPYTNCIVTANRSLLNNHSLFDAIVFHGPEILLLDTTHLVEYRLPHQKYVFASIESSDNYPLCSNNFDGYFNWTWTYRLDSDLRWGYIVIRNSEGKIIGPQADMNWLEWNAMDSVGKEFKELLKSKTKAVAWFVSHCQTRSDRHSVALALQKYLLRYNLDLDIYGACGHLKCPREKENECFKMIEKDYYFYLSFENAFSEDYVTEKLLIPLQNNAIPIVYGGANYSRFLPNGSYLNVGELGIRILGDKINELIKNPEMYAEYFKWKNHYSYHKTSESVETNEYCKMCSLLNDKSRIQHTSIYKNLREWWDPPSRSCESEQYF